MTRRTKKTPANKRRINLYRLTIGSNYNDPTHAGFDDRAARDQYFIEAATAVLAKAALELIEPGCHRVTCELDARNIRPNRSLDDIENPGYCYVTWDGRIL